MNLPIYVEKRIPRCRACHRAERRRRPDGSLGVALASRCLASPDQRTIRAAIEDPDFACPLRHFGRAVADARAGRLTHDGKAITGWSFAGLSGPVRAAPVRVKTKRRRSAGKGCDGCRGEAGMK